MIQTCVLAQQLSADEVARTCMPKIKENVTLFNRKTVQADIICYTSGWGINNLKETGRPDEKHLNSNRHNLEEP